VTAGADEIAEALETIDARLSAIERTLSDPPAPPPPEP
jgi:transcriptional regulator